MSQDYTLGRVENNIKPNLRQAMLQPLLASSVVSRAWFVHYLTIQYMVVSTTFAYSLLLDTDVLTHSASGLTGTDSAYVGWRRHVGMAERQQTTRGAGPSGRADRGE